MPPQGCRDFTPEQRREDVRNFFLDPNHWIYVSGGTPSSIGPSSVFHIRQLQVLFEDCHFHRVGFAAISELREQGFLQEAQVVTSTGNVIVVSRGNVRYVRRAVKAHAELVELYSNETISKACGAYAETLVDFGLTRLGLTRVARNAKAYNGIKWTETDHDLDFIFEGRAGQGYGVEVKNTFDYIPNEEMRAKIDMCARLGLVPVFVVRNRDSIQWHETQRAGGMLYMFKTKIFPPGQEHLVNRIWDEMRLPVSVRGEMPDGFYRTMDAFLKVN